MWTQGGKEKTGQIESSVDINALPCVKQRAGGELLYTQGAQLCDDLEGWDRGWAGGREALERRDIYELKQNTVKQLYSNF